jgi:hypothetical protein
MTPLSPLFSLTMRMDIESDKLLGSSMAAKRESHGGRLGRGGGRCVEDYS